ncbi:MAG: hypothetical protein WCK75_05195 [Elusimicrobiota bacterium]
MKNKYGISSENYMLIEKLISLIYPENEKPARNIFNRRTLKKQLIGCDFPAEVWQEAISMVGGAIQVGLELRSFQGCFEGFFVVPRINRPESAGAIRRNFRKKLLAFIKSEKAEQKISRKLERAEAESAGARPEAAVEITGKLIRDNPAYDFLKAHGRSLAAARPENFEDADNFFIGCLAAFAKTRTHSSGRSTPYFAAGVMFENLCDEFVKIADGFLRRNRKDYFAAFARDTFKDQNALGGGVEAGYSSGVADALRESAVLRLKKLPKQLHRITHRLLYCKAGEIGTRPMPECVARLTPAGLIFKTGLDADFESVFNAIEKLEGEDKRKAFAALRRFQNLIKWKCYMNWWVSVNWPGSVADERR